MEINKIISLLILIISVLLINIFFIEQLGIFRYIGLIGFGLVAYFWDNEVL